MNRMRRILFILLLINIPLLITIGALIAVEYKIDRNTIQELKAHYSEDVGTLAEIEQLNDNIILGVSREILKALDVKDHDVFTIYYCRIAGEILFITYASFLIILAILPLIVRRNRFLVLMVFKPLFYFTILFSVVYLIAEVSIVLVGLFFAETVFTGYVTPKLFLIIGLALLVGIWSIIHSIYVTFFKNSRFVEAVTINQEEQGRVWAFVRDIAAKLQAKVPANILVGLDANFYVTEGKIELIDKKIVGETLYVSLPLCRILQEEELAFIIGHELAHFSGRDVKYSKKFYPIYSIAVHSIGRLEAQESIILYPVVVLLRIFLDGFEYAEKEISRYRELAADKRSVDMTNNRIKAATALLKVQAYAPIMEVLMDRNYQEIKQGRAFKNLSIIYEELAKDVGKEDLLSHIDSNVEKHPTDTHPPICERLSALNITQDEIMNDALQINNIDNKAIYLFEDFEKIEEELTDMNVAVTYSFIQSANVGNAENKD